MLNAIQPGSYVRPQRHLDPPKAEAWIVLRGAVLFVTFFDDGAIADHVVLNTESGTFGVDLVPGHYHTLAALRPDSIIYEVKTGPYEATTDKSFAPWAPEEGTVEAQNYLSNLLKACGLDDPSLSHLLLGQRRMRSAARAFRPRMVCIAPMRARVTFQMAGCVVILNYSERGGSTR